MEITEVRIKLMDDAGDRLRAFCSITFDDCFVVRDLKIIEGSSGPFVAMPSRKLTSHCAKCGCKNHRRALYCNQCGGRQQEDASSGRETDGRAKLYADIAHPINSNCREMIQERVILEYHSELERAAEPGYVSRYDEFFSDAGEEGGSSDYDSPAKPEATSPVAAEPETTPSQTVSPPAKPQPSEPAPPEPASDAPAETRPRETTQVQPPETEPRGPHRPPGRTPGSRPKDRQSRGRGSDEFGAGIF